VTQYSVERCQGAGCSTFAQIGTSTGTTFSDTGLTNGTSYSYRVRATDAAGNLSGYSNTAGATTLDTQPPTAPANLTATAASGSQINLSWTASSDNVGVTQYLIERCQNAGCTAFTQIGTSTGSTLNDTGLTPNASYSYRVRATDAAGNLSGYSSVASAVTPANTIISYVQGNYADPQTPQTTVNVTVTAAQIAGDLNVVVVGWNDSTVTVSSVTDVSGNTYTLAVGPTVEAGVATQSIYYARNIVGVAAGANTVRVTFSNPARYSDIRILEYSGVDPANPVDVTAASTGNSSSSNSGLVTTTYPTDLLFGANIVQTTTTGAGSSFATRLLTSPDADIAEDRMVTVTGSYSATAPVSPSGQWIMQLVAFRTPASGGDIQPPTAPSNLTTIAPGGNQINLSWTASADNVGVAQYLVERCQGVGCTNFAQIGAATGTTFNDTGLAGDTSYSYRVRAIDAAGNRSGYSNVASAATGLGITPRVTVLTFTRTQQFTATSGGVTWSVDGAAGGLPTSGTITASGLYTPPASAGNHIVTATTSNPPLTANATVYITNYAGTFTRDVDRLRTGLNANEIVLTPANVNVAQFGKLFSYSINGTADASPLYVANVNIPGTGFRNVVYVATEHDSVYAFDADGLQSGPLWSVSFINPAGGITPVPSMDTGECCDLAPEIGITGTPVIDPATNTLYVIAKTKEVSRNRTNYFHRLHALDITTGAEKFGGPVVIQASVPGTGDGSQGGRVSFQSLHENQRCALLLNNGVVYIAFGGHGDQRPYHGWLLGYNAQTLVQVMAYNTSPNDPGNMGIGGSGSGIWMSGDGLATDSAGNIYFVTGNGLFDVDSGGSDYGDSFLKVGPTGSVLDFFTPHDQQNMNLQDLDLGSGGVLLLPDQPGPHPHLALTAGKSGTIYLLDRDNLGGYNPNNDNQIVQSIVNIFPNGNWHTGNFKAPVYWNGSLYYSADADYIKSFAVSNGLIIPFPTSQSSFILNYPGATLGISANGTSNAILWAVQRVDLDPTGGGVQGPGSLHAFDATNLRSGDVQQQSSPRIERHAGFHCQVVCSSGGQRKSFRRVQYPTDRLWVAAVRSGFSNKGRVARHAGVGQKLGILLVANGKVCIVSQRPAHRVRAFAIEQPRF
jgi:chitodextrinase